MYLVEPEPPRILVAVPPSGPVGHLTAFAGALADQTGARLLLATVVSVPRITPYSAAEGTARRRKERLAVLGNALARVVPTEHVAVVADGAAQGLVELARRRGATLVVAGWPRSSGSFSFFGQGESAVSGLLRRAPCHVCVVERLPARTPELVLVAPSSGSSADLGLRVGRAMIAASGGFSATLPEPRVEVLNGEDTGAMLERASELGADVLVTDALEERGVWPVRRKVLRRELPRMFPGAVGLLHSPEALATGTRARSAGTSVRLA